MVEENYDCCPACGAELVGLCCPFASVVHCPSCMLSGPIRATGVESIEAFDKHCRGAEDHTRVDALRAKLNKLQRLEKCNACGGCGVIESHVGVTTETVVCDECGGTGAAAGQKLKRDLDAANATIAELQHNGTCPRCDGTGQIMGAYIKRSCPECGGTGLGDRQRLKWKLEVAEARIAELERRGGSSPISETVESLFGEAQYLHGD